MTLVGWIAVAIGGVVVILVALVVLVLVAFAVSLPEEDGKWNE